MADKRGEQGGKGLPAVELRQIILADRMAAGVIRDAEDTAKGIARSTEQQKAAILKEAAERREELTRRVRERREVEHAERMRADGERFEARRQALERAFAEGREERIAEIAARLTSYP